MAMFLHKRHVLIGTTVIFAVLQTLNLFMVFNGRWLDGILGGHVTVILAPAIASLVAGAVVILLTTKVDF